jgi:hypothetical protein
MKQDAEEPFLSCSLFGRVPNLAYYYGTLPALGEGGGPQPVVFIDGHEMPFAIPVASHVDSFFETYARYLEQTTQEEAARILQPSAGESAPHYFFPWTAPELLRTDERLISWVSAGRFNFLANGHPDALKWLQRLQELG